MVRPAGGAPGCLATALWQAWLADHCPACCSGMCGGSLCVDSVFWLLSCAWLLQFWAGATTTVWTGGLLAVLMYVLLTARQPFSSPKTHDPMEV